MKKQAVQQILKGMMAWQLQLEEQLPQVFTMFEKQDIYDQQNLLEGLRTQLATQHDLKDESAKEWAWLKSTWEEKQIEQQRHQEIRHQAQIADQIRFRYLTVIETGEAVVVDGKSQLSVSTFPHQDPEEFEAFKTKYIHEAYSCCRLDLTVPAVRTHLGLDEV